MLRAAGWFEEKLKRRPKGDIKKPEWRRGCNRRQRWRGCGKRSDWTWGIGEQPATQCGPARENEENIPLVISDPFIPLVISDKH
jgi:hypothetical protein